MAEMNELLAEFLKAEEDHGFGVGGGTLPIGVYPVLIEKVPRVDGGRRKTENGVELLGTPNARLQLRVLDGRALRFCLALVRLLQRRQPARVRPLQRLEFRQQLAQRVLGHGADRH